MLQDASNRKEGLLSHALAAVTAREASEKERAG
jgi:hypothetical protein